jgi:hypothetical protein
MDEALNPQKNFKNQTKQLEDCGNVRALAENFTSVSDGL